jgi:plasmid stabilization system protein ParE
VIYKLEIRPDALSDIDGAAAWYEEREAGLGSDFARTVKSAIATLQTNPLAQKLRNRRRNVRWILTSRFPYKIVYHVNGTRSL